MLLFIAFIFILLKMIGIINLSWNMVIIGELVLLFGLILEAKYIYKKINERFK
ncbi:hypothetical protein EA74_00457 [Enterococcus hirae]|uniref:Uncharacterized protein n=2 Tax=Enterococcus TaxID=1350 RepID=A0AB37I8V4_ENTHR|nr:hypothetical protein OK7_05631 [Enterococcus faecium EnGen0024]EPI26140.1 hypothetical protein D352_00114 [Enterococcus faecium LA4B-2]ERT44400.1 hypothetical protein O991_03436 [Enterococcus faecium 10/96A]RBT42399.1 hypothetical protein EB07_01810 [Enterococcus hirae]RBT56800.1 hypothetical protein EA74_00457 [Enterococcus hirae]